MLFHKRRAGARVSAFRYRNSPAIAGKLATAGLAAALTLVPVLIFLGGLESYHAGVASKRANAVSDAFEQARYSVSTEESLERKYRLEPGRSVREAHAQAATSLLFWLNSARRLEGNEGVAAVDDVLTQHKAYLSAVARMFSAIDADDPARARAIDEAEADPSFSAMERQVTEGANRHRLEALRQSLAASDTRSYCAIGFCSNCGGNGAHHPPGPLGTGRGMSPCGGMADPGSIEAAAAGER